MIAKHSHPKIHNTHTYVNLAVVAGFVAAGLLLLVDNPIFAVFAACLPLGVFILINWPEMGLAGLIFIAYINLSSIIVNIYDGPSLLKPLIPAMLIVAIATLVLRKQYLPNLSMSVPFLLMYGLVIATTLFVARDPALTQEGLEVYLKNMVIVLIMLFMIRDLGTLRLIVWSLILAGFFLGSLSIYQQITQTFDNSYWGFAQADFEEVIGGVRSVRIGGPIISTNQYAMIMMALVPLGLDRFLAEKDLFLKGLAFASAIFSFLTVIFTFSRSGFLAMTVALIVWVIVRGLNIRLLITVGLLALFLFPFVPRQYTDRLASLGELVASVQNDDLAQIQDLSFRGRLSEQIAAVQMFIDHPILGVGFDNYDVYYLDYSENIGLDSRREERQAHNLYLEVLAETGIVGFVVFGSILIFSLWHLLLTRKFLIKSGKTESAMIAGAILASNLGYLAGSVFLHASHPRYFWILFGLVLVVPTALYNSKHTEENPVSLASTLGNDYAK